MYLLLLDIAHESQDSWMFKKFLPGFFGILGALLILFLIAYFIFKPMVKDKVEQFKPKDDPKQKQKEKEDMLKRYMTLESGLKKSIAKKRKSLLDSYIILEDNKKPLLKILDEIIPRFTEKIDYKIQRTEAFIDEIEYLGIKSYMPLEKELTKIIIQERENLIDSYQIIDGNKKPLIKIFDELESEIPSLIDYKIRRMDELIDQNNN